jgi:hypothetical protein
MTDDFHMGDMKNMINAQPVMDSHEKTYGQLTPDQYDKLMRRLHNLEQKITLLGQQDYKATQIDQVFDRQHHIEKQLKRIDKMLVKIGLALFRRAVKDDKETP